MWTVALIFNMHYWLLLLSYNRWYIKVNTVTLNFANWQHICIFFLKYRKYTTYFKQSILHTLTRKYLKYYFRYFLSEYFVKYFKYLSKSIYPITVPAALLSSEYCILWTNVSCWLLVLSTWQLYFYVYYLSLSCYFWSLIRKKYNKKYF